jgi:hypothetical protein
MVDVSMDASEILKNSPASAGKHQRYKDLGMSYAIMSSASTLSACWPRN